MKQNPTPKNVIKALKRAAREDFGLEPTHITSNRRKYARSREKGRTRRIIGEAVETAAVA